MTKKSVTSLLRKPKMPLTNYFFFSNNFHHYSINHFFIRSLSFLTLQMMMIASNYVNLKQSLTRAHQHFRPSNNCCTQLNKNKIKHASLMRHEATFLKWLNDCPTICHWTLIRCKVLKDMHVLEYITHSSRVWIRKLPISVNCFEIINSSYNKQWILNLKFLIRKIHHRK